VHHSDAHSTAWDMARQTDAAARGAQRRVYGWCPKRENGLVALICLVYLLCLVYLVCLVLWLKEINQLNQINKTNQINQTNDPLTPAG